MFTIKNNLILLKKQISEKSESQNLLMVDPFN